ncbi:MAG: hypothetical protein WC623_21485 [Pedobacter sp.]|uniref:hypothetical protein n=1 Tax=Pedobacter sp. TaxID=1411316 RepID=UPI00356ABE09
MKARLFKKKLPQVLDYALAIVISSVPGFAEADSSTKALYQSITKEMLAQELKSKGRFAGSTIKLIRKKAKQSRLKASA